MWKHRHNLGRRPLVADTKGHGSPTGAHHRLQTMHVGSRFRLPSNVVAGVVPTILCCAGFLFLSALALYRHDRYESFGFDLGIFDQAVWGYSHFEIVENTVKRIPNLLGDHFHPILIAVAPTYWIWNDARILLVVQALLLSLASVPIYLWTRSVVDRTTAALLQLTFLLFWGILAGALFDFHELAVAVPAISFGIYALLTRRDKLFWAMVVVGSLSKEDIALTFAFMGLYAIVVQRRWTLGATAVVACILWFVATIKLMIPALAAGRGYVYWSYWKLGNGPLAAVGELVGAPWKGLGILVDRSEKARTLTYITGSWMFAPLLSPLFLIAIPSLAERFWSVNRDLWAPANQYTLPLAPILAFAAADSIRRYRELIAPRWSFAPAAIAAAILGCTIGLDAWAVRPLEPLRHYMSSARAADISSCLSTVPDGASVAASNALVPHLSHRRAIFPLFARTDEEFLAIDARSVIGDRALAAVRTAHAKASAASYRVTCARGGVFILRRVRGPALRRN
jgi:uncharacterized membrane protein